MALGLETEVILMERYFDEFGQSFSTILYNQLTELRRKEIGIAMAKALAGQREPILDQELFPSMDFADKGMRF